MAWVVGVDEAGYGPNLGPFVMTAVACRVPQSCLESDLWHALRPAVRRGRDADGGELLIDDSKVVHKSRGVAGLERGVLATLSPAASLADLLDRACPDHHEELRREVWYRGMQALPVHVTPDELGPCAARFEAACRAAGVTGWQVRSVVVCPSRFNALLEEGGKKGVVLAHGLAHLLRRQHADLAGDEPLVFFVDKHGGRNRYAALIQHALPGGVVWTGQEGMALSTYRVHGLGRDVHLSFQPRADAEHFCVALASMTSKYLRELLMLEFNRFWREHLPELKPTAGYPGDADRFFAEIRPALEKLGLPEEAVWRRR